MSDLIKAMTYDYPERIPVSLWFMPATWKKYGDEISRLCAEYPDLAPQGMTPDKVPMPDSYRYGSFTDEWGCVWSNLHEGMESIVTGHPVKTREDILKLEIPTNRDGRMPHGFMYLRLLDLRGFEEAMMDFAEEAPELDVLIDKVLRYNLIQLDVVLPDAGPVAIFGDDLGMQQGLAIGAAKWRKYLKPCYKALYDKVHASGRYVYMHTDGRIIDIMDDLVECGVNMINPQFRANGLEDLVRVCKGRIPINLDLDRQMFPFATPAQLKEHVAQVVQALYLPQGGLGIYAEFSPDMPVENMAAVLDALRQWRDYRG